VLPSSPGPPSAEPNSSAGTPAAPQPPHSVRQRAWGGSCAPPRLPALRRAGRRSGRAVPTDAMGRKEPEGGWADRHPYQQFVPGWRAATSRRRTREEKRGPRRGRRSGQRLLFFLFFCFLFCFFFFFCFLATYLEQNNPGPQTIGLRLWIHQSTSRPDARPRPRQLHTRSPAPSWSAAVGGSDRDHHPRQHNHLLATALALGGPARNWERRTRHSSRASKGPSAGLRPSRIHQFRRDRRDPAKWVRRPTHPHLLNKVDRGGHLAPGKEPELSQPRSRGVPSAALGTRNHKATEQEADSHTRGRVVIRR